MKKLLFKPWIEEQAALHNVDGCTGVTNWNGHCCRVHDLEFKTGRSATNAYTLYVRGVSLPWQLATRVTFDEANDHFNACNFRENALGYWNPFAWLRYSVGRLRKTRAAWDKHRAAEQAEA